MNMPQPDRLYARPFFLLLGGLFAYMCGFSLMVHLPKFIVFRGGDISTVAWVFGVGKTGSLITRPFMGDWIDRVGCKPVLLASTIGAAAVLLIFPWFTSTPLICGLRVLLEVTLAASLAAVAVFSARIAPPGRSAESLAMIGIGGLAGFMLGPILGEAILRTGPNETPSFHLFFTIGAAFALLGTLFVLINRPPASPPIPKHRPSFLKLMVRHWPGPLAVMGVCLAIAQTIPVMFIERFIKSRDLPGVTMFFIAYAPTAILLRVVLARLPERIGRRRTLILGMSSYVLGLLLLTRVHSEWGLLLPAIVMGVGHCFSYPFLLDLAAETMPPENRGLATSLILGVVDVGFLVGFVGEGQLIKHYGFDTTLMVCAATTALGTLYFGWTQRRTIFAPAK